MTEPTPDPAAGPLAGLRVLDLGVLIQGPQAALLLGEMGADVVKVEQPGIGDHARWVVFAADDLRAPFFVASNRGKRSITLDLRRDEGRAVFLRLVDTADVLITNFATGTMDGWGLGPDVLAERNPRLINASGSTFGTRGPHAHRKGADLAAQAAGGFMTAMVGGDEDPAAVGVTIADHIASQNMVAGILAALLVRERSGRGQTVESSLLGGMIYAQASEYTAAALLGHDVGAPVAGGHPLIPGVYGVVPTADGHIAIVGVAGPERAAFFGAIGRLDLLDDERFAATVILGDDQADLFAAIGEATRTMSSDALTAALDEAGIRWAPVLDRCAAAADEGAHANGYVHRVEHPEWGSLTLPGVPIRMGATPLRPAAVAPELGQHTEELLLELGYEWAEITALRDTGVI